ncbi:uncharacterized protein LOC120332178 [Styela clava]|uniref:uncharacterized protein LOC120332178 n=1 Tax=Styela clava TaxID=7725 RepID=UPI0019398A30|nr:uncharacterized protein LOC120332178 [Styela clava]
MRGNILQKSFIALQWKTSFTSQYLVAPTQVIKSMNVGNIRFIADAKNSGSKLEATVFQDDHHRDGRWWNISTEWKVACSFVVAVTSFFLNARYERIQVQKEIKLNRIQSQIKDLYGPLYGNRLVSDTSYRAVMKSHKGLKKYLSEARRKKDAEMIHCWRSYVWNVLYPLDKAAVDLILNNAHLIAQGEFPKEFEQLLMHAARMEFVMESWKNDDGALESAKRFDDDDYLEVSNASGLIFRTQILTHVKQKYDTLRDEQKQILLDISSDKQADDILAKIYQKVTHQDL